jgi:hypothetical protein
MGGAKHRCEDLLGLRPAGAAVAAADFAHRDGGPNRVLGPPVGRVDGRIAEEREQRRGFDGQMGGEPLDGRQGGVPGGEQVEHLLEQPAPRDSEAVRRDLSGGVPVAQRQGLLQELLDTPSKRTPGMIELEQPTSTQEMRETRLMIGVHEATVRRPTVTGEHAREVCAQRRDGIAKPATGANRVDRGRWSGERPEPVQGARHFPPRLVRTHDRTAPDLRTQGVVRRGRARRRAGTEMDERTARDAQTESIAEERDDVRERQAQSLVQDHDERGGLRADLYRRRAERVRGLQRMAALNAPATHRTRPHMNAKLADDGADHRQVLLILGDDVGVVHRAATRRARRWQWCVEGRIDARRDGSRSVAAVRCAGAPARWTATALSVGFGERRGLAETRAPRRIELILEAFVAALQSIALVLGPGQRVAQPSDLLPLASDQRVAIVRRRRRVHIGHTPVMPEGRNSYKYEILDRWRPVKQRRIFMLRGEPRS